MNNEQVERGVNSPGGKNIVLPNEFQIQVSEALNTDMEWNQTFFAALEKSVEGIVDKDETITASQNAAKGIETSLKELDELQHQVRSDRTRDEAQKLFVFNKKSESTYEFIQGRFEYLRSTNAARHAAGVSNLFSSTANSLSPMELSMIPEVVKQINQPNGTLAATTENEARATIYLLSNYPSLIKNKNIDPMIDQDAIKHDSDMKFSPGAYAAVKNSLQMQDAIKDFELSIGQKRAQMAPGNLLNQLKEERI